MVAVDKTNPLYAPDNFEPWRNAGYTNLAPKVRAAAVQHAYHLNADAHSARGCVCVYRRVVRCVCGSSLRRMRTDGLQPRTAVNKHAAFDTRTLTLTRRARSPS